VADETSRSRRTYFIDLIADELRELPAPAEHDFYRSMGRLLPARGTDPDAQIIAAITWPEVLAKLRARPEAPALTVVAPVSPREEPSDAVLSDQEASRSSNSRLVASDALGWALARATGRRRRRR
jgi:hypothetical protein